jgi:hypothetical protein
MGNRFEVLETYAPGHGDAAVVILQLFAFGQSSHFSPRWQVSRKWGLFTGRTLAALLSISFTIQFQMLLTPNRFR